MGTHRWCRDRGTGPTASAWWWIGWWWCCGPGAPGRWWSAHWAAALPSPTRASGRFLAVIPKQNPNTINPAFNKPPHRSTSWTIRGMQSLIGYLFVGNQSAFHLKRPFGIPLHGLDLLLDDPNHAVFRTVLSCYTVELVQLSMACSRSLATDSLETNQLFIWRDLSEYHFTAQTYCF